MREAVGWDVSRIDHFGNLSVKDAIRLGRPWSLGLAWMEDIMPWYDVDGMRR